MNKNKAGVCWISFKKDTTDEKIQEIISDFYVKNKKSIEGMEFNQIVNVISMREGKKLAQQSWKESNGVSADSSHD